MLLIDAFFNREMYISPEDEITIYHEVNKLMDVWKEIILKHSNDKITELTPDKQEILSNIINDLQDFQLNNGVSIASQLDKKIVEILLWGASNFLHQCSVIDEIYKKTRNSMFQYFYHELILKAYLRIGAVKEAINVIKFMFDKNHQAYFYAILRYDSSKFKNKDFIQNLNEYKKKVIIKLLAIGESVSLSNVTFIDLLEIVEEVKKDIAKDLVN